MTRTIFNDISAGQLAQILCGPDGAHIGRLEEERRNGELLKREKRSGAAHEPSRSGSRCHSREIPWIRRLVSNNFKGRRAVLGNNSNTLAYKRIGTCTRGRLASAPKKRLPC
jgi:hypothetical protein